LYDAGVQHHRDLRRAIGERIQQLRMEAGLSVAKLAGDSSIGTAAAMARVERGDVAAPVEALDSLAVALRVPLLALFTFPAQDFFQELVDKLRHIRFGELQGMLAMVGNRARPREARPGRTEIPSLDDLARWILALPGRGSKLEVVQRAVLLHALEISEGNVSAAARLLGINRKAFERRLARIREE
jgi:transcriptional regulator with XRE-family HTH domain